LIQSPLRKTSFVTQTPYAPFSVGTKFYGTYHHILDEVKKEPYGNHANHLTKKKKMKEHTVHLEQIGGGGGA
jgi:hypothetical protein